MLMELAEKKAAAGTAAGSYVDKMDVSGAGWAEGNNDFGSIKVRPGADMVLTTARDKKKMLLLI